MKKNTLKRNHSLTITFPPSHENEVDLIWGLAEARKCSVSKVLLEIIDRELAKETINIEAIVDRSDVEKICEKLRVPRDIAIDLICDNIREVLRKSFGALARVQRK